MASTTENMCTHLPLIPGGGGLIPGGGMPIGVPRVGGSPIGGPIGGLIPGGGAIIPRKKNGRNKSHINHLSQNSSIKYKIIFKELGPDTK